MRRKQWTRKSDHVAVFVESLHFNEGDERGVHGNTFNHRNGMLRMSCMKCWTVLPLLVKVEIRFLTVGFLGRLGDEASYIEGYALAYNVHNWIHFYRHQFAHRSVTSLTSFCLPFQVGAKRRQLQPVVVSASPTRVAATTTAPPRALQPRNSSTTAPTLLTVHSP